MEPRIVSRSVMTLDANPSASNIETTAHQVARSSGSTALLPPGEVTLTGPVRTPAGRHASRASGPPPRTAHGCPPTVTMLAPGGEAKFAPWTWIVPPGALKFGN